MGEIYCNGYGVKKDYLRTKEYYELSSKQGNSEAFLRLGTLHFNGFGVKQDYLIAKEYFEISANKNNPDALYNLGEMYYNGQGVEQDYLKASEYYELSTRQGNSDAPLKLGNLYLNGNGVKQDYSKVIEYYELAFYRNNPDAPFYLAEFYSDGFTFNADIPKAIQYYQKSIEIHYDKIKTFSNMDSFYTLKNIYNRYFYHSNNNLCLIYITIFNDIDKATPFIKEAAFGEYPFGQNNFGLLNGIYFNNIENAEYMYLRSSKNKFAFAEFNLGYLKEKNGKIDDSIEHYLKASEYEDFPLIFHNRQHNDKRLEISKIFIMCFTNLKLTEYFFVQGNFIESKKYFVKSFAKLNNNNESIQI
ncbi:hypothetical protein M9Y10_029931 [Tritrichomonas musculus]|uniref:Uncharacterized protein n=1 Tax=Tritrichomonas musculus TaxID=1915356 RepID=A0ABR2KNQ2_9EUKA